MSCRFIINYYSHTKSVPNKTIMKQCIIQEKYKFTKARKYIKMQTMCKKMDEGCTSRREGKRDRKKL